MRKSNGVPKRWAAAARYFGISTGIWRIVRVEIAVSRQRSFRGSLLTLTGGRPLRGE
jgi:hypothetical protein